MSKKQAARKSKKKAALSHAPEVAVVHAPEVAVVKAASGCELSFDEMLNELEAIVTEADMRLAEEEASL